MERASDARRQMRAGRTVVGVDHHEVDDDPLPEHAQAVPRVVVAGHPLEEVLAPVDGLDKHRGDEADHDAERDEHEHRQHVLHRLLRLRAGIGRRMCRHLERLRERPELLQRLTELSHRRHGCSEGVSERIQTANTYNKLT